MSERPLATGGYLLYSQVGDDFCEIGTIESAEPIEWDNKYAGNYVSLDLDKPTDLTFQFKEKQWNKLKKVLGLYEYKFKKVKKGKRMVRLVI